MSEEEAVARAICKADGYSPNDSYEVYLKHAREAIAALDKYREGNVLADPNMDRRAELGGLAGLAARGYFPASTIQDDQEKGR